MLNSLLFLQITWIDIHRVNNNKFTDISCILCYTTNSTLYHKSQHRFDTEIVSSQNYIRAATIRYNFTENVRQSSSGDVWRIFPNNDAKHDDFSRNKKLRDNEKCRTREVLTGRSTSDVTSTSDYGQRATGVLTGRCELGECGFSSESGNSCERKRRLSNIHILYN